MHTWTGNLHDAITPRRQVVVAREDRRGQAHLLPAGSFCGGQPPPWGIAHNSGITHDAPPHQSLSPSFWKIFKDGTHRYRPADRPSSPATARAAHRGAVIAVTLSA
jgi:hypothetical protein